jgi:aspartate carbamoyltransferase catalytic subunit
MEIDELSQENIINILCKAFDFEHENEIYIFKHTLKHKIIGLVFFEQSTRSLLSFQSAILRLGGNHLTFQKDLSSLKKGESINDTIKTIEQFCDALVIRHPEKGFLKKYKENSKIPILNAGDGDGEHPSQAFLDLFTILHFHKTPFKIAFCGDLKHSRTVHSLLKLMDKIYEHVTIYLISTSDLILDKEYYPKRNKVVENTSLVDIIETIDVLYMTRIHKERHDNDNKYDNEYVNSHLTSDLLERSKKDMIVLHPLPRNEELPEELDNNNKIKIFEQLKCGVYIRMALLDFILNKK